MNRISEPTLLHMDVRMSRAQDAQERPPLPPGEGWGEGACAEPWQPSPSFPLPEGEGGEPRRARRAHFLISGFTLIEVLIALAVLAIALSAVLYAMGQAIDVSANLRERTVALWVVEERATEYQLNRKWPGLDTTEGTQEFGGREWRWRDRVIATPLEELRRVDIEIRAPNSPDMLARLTIFLRRP